MTEAPTHGASLPDFVHRRDHLCADLSVRDVNSAIYRTRMEHAPLIGLGSNNVPGMLITLTRGLTVLNR